MLINHLGKENNLCEINYLNIYSCLHCLYNENSISEVHSVNSAGAIHRNIAS